MAKRNTTRAQPADLRAKALPLAPFKPLPPRKPENSQHFEFGHVRPADPDWLCSCGRNRHEMLVAIEGAQGKTWSIQPCVYCKVTK